MASPTICNLDDDAKIGPRMLAICNATDCQDTAAEFTTWFMMRLLGCSD